MISLHDTLGGDDRKPAPDEAAATAARASATITTTIGARVISLVLHPPPLTGSALDRVVGKRFAWAIVPDDQPAQGWQVGNLLP